MKPIHILSLAILLNLDCFAGQPVSGGINLSNLIPTSIYPTTSPHTGKQALKATSGTSSDGTQSYVPFSNFNSTPSITYPTNIVLKWYLTAPAGPLFASISLAPDGTLYVPFIFDSASQAPGGLLSIKLSSIDTNSPGYPSAVAFENWDYQSNIDNTFTPTVGVDGTVYAERDVFSYPENYQVLALNPTNAAVRWSFLDIGQSPGSVAVGNDGTVYTADASYVYALTNAPGSTSPFTNAQNYILQCTNVGVKWSYFSGTVNAPFPFNRGPICVGLDGTVYVFDTYASGKLFAFNPTNGALKWTTADISGPIVEETPVSPAIARDGTVYIGHSTNFCAVDPGLPITNGVMGFKWRLTDPVITLSTGSTFYNPVIGVDGTVYVECIVFDGSDLLFALNPDSGVVKWKIHLGSWFGEPGSYWKSGSLAVAADGEIYLAGLNDTLYSFDPAGNTNWLYSVGDGSLGSPLIGPDGTIYVESAGGSSSCNIYAFQGQSPVACSAWPEDGKNARRNAAVATASVSMSSMTNGVFKFVMTGFSNMPVCACSCSDLKTWTNNGQTILTGGKTNFIDAGATNYPYRFYRAFPQ